MPINSNFPNPLKMRIGCVNNKESWLREGGAPI